MISQIAPISSVEILEFNSQPQSSFHEQPSEIFVKIFQSFSKSELGVLGCVCRKFSFFENDALLSIHTKLKQSNTVFSYSLNEIDLESEKSVKMHVKESTITLSNMIICPNFIEISNKSIFLKADIILCRGKVSFIGVQSKNEYTNLAVKAMQYLSKNGYMVLYQIPDDTKHTYIYNENVNVRILTIIGKFCDHLHDKEVKNIKQGRTQIKVEYPKRDRFEYQGNRLRY